MCFPDAHIKKVIRDDKHENVDSMMFMIVLTEDDPITVHSAQREEVITELQIFWRTDVMVISRKTPPITPPRRP